MDSKEVWKFLAEHPKPWDYYTLGKTDGFHDANDKDIRGTELLAYIQHLEAENECLKPLAEVGELVNRLPELFGSIPHSNYIELTVYKEDGWTFEVSREFPGYSDYCNRAKGGTALEMLRKAFGEV